MTSEPANPLENGVTAELYKAAIGPQGQAYYVRHFLKFDAAGKTGASWHWPACGATLSWLVFRKMWGWALAYGAALVLLALVVFGVGKLVFDYSESTGLLLLLLFLSAALVLPGLYANAWYYTYCSGKISAALRNAATVKEACDVLAGQASTRRRWFGLAAANVAVLALLASGATLVLNLGQEGAYLAQMKRAKPAAADLTVTVPPAVAAANGVGAEPAPPTPSASQPAAVTAELASRGTPAGIEESVAKTADKTTEKAAATSPQHGAVQAEPSAVPAPPEPAQVAAAKTDKQISTVKPMPTGADAKPKAANARRQWFVQVGAFAKEANAQNVRLKVEATGLQSAAEPSDTPAGRLIRVRAGPFASKADAEKAALQIKALDLPAVLVRQ